MFKWYTKVMISIQLIKINESDHEISKRDVDGQNTIVQNTTNKIPHLNTTE